MESDFTGIEAKLDEAEVYRSMGLWGEALAVYERLLSDGAVSKNSRHGAEIERRMLVLK